MKIIPDHFSEMCQGAVSAFIVTYILLRWTAPPLKLWVFLAGMLFITAIAINIWTNIRKSTGQQKYKVPVEGYDGNFRPGLQCLACDGWFTSSYDAEGHDCTED